MRPQFTSTLEPRRCMMAARSKTIGQSRGGSEHQEDAVGIEEHETATDMYVLTSGWRENMNYLFGLEEDGNLIRRLCGGLTTMRSTARSLKGVGYRTMPANEITA